jgi:uncharacterized protein YbjT (DUF2867 family)
MYQNNRRVLVTGGATFLGDNIAAALLAEGAEVTLLVRPGAEDKLGPLAQRARWWTADVWDPASLRGRARGHMAVIHTVGSMVADPAQGLTHQRLNLVSARNVANMCVSDGVPQMVLMSSVRAPWVSRRYIAAKREAEAYMLRVGLKATIIRAPVVYVRGRQRPMFYQFMTLLGSVPPISWLGFNRIAPMPADILARGVARIALEGERTKTYYYAPDLRRRNKREEIRRVVPLLNDARNPYMQPHPFQQLDEDTPFGWLPPEKDE